jgi:probable HAF family extracellular repeat protein
MGIADAVNNSGQIVGMSETSSGRRLAFTSTATGPMQQISAFGGASSRGYAINNNGQVTGYLYRDSGGAPNVPGWPGAYIYDPTTGTVTGLGTAGWLASDARGINNLGQVVGILHNGAGPLEDAFFYSDGVMHDLGTLGAQRSGASAINDEGTFVGAFGNTQAYRGFIGHGTVLQDLNDLISPTLGWIIEDASDINNNGQIVGTALDAQQVEHAVLLDPVRTPEPSTFIVWSLLGGLGIAVGWWRRKRAA